MQIVVRGTVTSDTDPLAGGSGSIMKRTTTANLGATIERWGELGRTNIHVEVVNVSSAHVPLPAPKRRPSDANLMVIARRQNAGGLSGAVLSQYPSL